MVSVVVPVYNIEKYVDKCVESIVSQSFSDIEILLVDDGSTDSSGNRCDSWGKKDTRIRVFHQKNKGVSSARNTGLHHRRGDYLVFVDGDDSIHPDYIHLLYLEAVRTTSDIVFCNYKYVNESGDSIYNNNYTYFQKTRAMSSLELLSCFENRRYSTFFDVLWNKIYRSSLFDGLEFPVGVSLVEDIWVLPVVYHRCGKASVLDEKLYYYLYRENSMSHGTFTRGEDYRFRKPMMENRVEMYCQWDIKELILISLIHLYSLVTNHERKAGDGLRDIQRKYRKVYFRGRYAGAVSWRRKGKYLLAAINLFWYTKLARRKTGKVSRS